MYMLIILHVITQSGVDKSEYHKLDKLSRH